MKAKLTSIQVFINNINQVQYKVVCDRCHINTCVRVFSEAVFALSNTTSGTEAYIGSEYLKQDNGILDH